MFRTNCEPILALLNIAAEGHRLSKRVTESRWAAAQKLELAFWRQWKTLPPYQDLDIAQYWRQEVTRFGETWACFDGLRVLDVGCGPLGLIHFLENASERVRVDPLLLSYDQKLPLVGPQLSLAAMAESPPLAAQSVDFAVCYNALDHMMDPESALDELVRVLRHGATVLLMIHTFPAWLRPLFGIDRLHPLHYTAASFHSMVEARFQIDRFESVRRRFEAPPGKSWTPAFWKYRAGNLVVSSTYVRAHAF